MQGRAGVFEHDQPAYVTRDLGTLGRADQMASQHGENNTHADRHGTGRKRGTQCGPRIAPTTVATRRMKPSCPLHVGFRSVTMTAAMKA